MGILNERKPGYKHTPLGWIPKEWQAIELGNCFSLSSGKTKPNEISISPNEKHLYPVYGGNGIIGYSKEFNIQGENIVIGRVGEYCGVTRYVKGKAWITDNALVTKSIDDQFEPLFLSYKLQQEDISKLRNKGGQPLITQGPIYLHTVALPSDKTEQIYITRIISVYDEALTKIQQVIGQLKQRNNGLMNELLSPKKHWKTYQIGSILKEIRRPISWNDEEKYDLISVRRRSAGVFFRESLLGKQILTKQLFSVEEGDFLISKMQIVHGASAIVTGNLAGMKISGSYIAVRAKDDRVLDINFFNWISKTRKFYRMTYTSSFGVHIEKMTFDYEDFKSRRLDLPPVNEQRKIVEILETSAQELRYLEQEHSTLQLQKKGIMQQLLTGAIRVKI